jgi:hypothetical protein
MEKILRQIKQILVIATLLLCMQPLFAQKKTTANNKPKHISLTGQFADFRQLTQKANVSFVFPHGFREVKAPSDEDFSFDYAMELPGKGFEIWFQIKPEKEDWFKFEQTQNNPNRQFTNPDSLYSATGRALASQFTGDRRFFTRTIPPEVLARYNADSGKSYLLTLLDLPQTKHYKYALLITLQKNHTSTILAVCFTNDKGPEFFKNLDRASHCVKFKVEKV